VSLDLRFPDNRRTMAFGLSQRARCSCEKARRWVEAGNIMAGGWIGSRLFAAGVAMGVWKRDETKERRWRMVDVWEVRT